MTNLCERGYQAALMDPFNAPPTCVPIWPSPDSLKQKFFWRSVVPLLGTAGFGFVTARPVFSYNPLSSNSGVFYSTASFTGTTVTTGVATGVYGANPNSPWATTLFGTENIQGRCVSAGIRVRYVGTQLAMNGTVAALEQPAHSTQSSNAFSDLLDYDRTKVMPIKKEWIAAVWTPKYQSELDYNPLGDYPSGNTGFGYPLAICVQADQTQTGVNAFEVEYYVIAEFIGELVRGVSPNTTSPRSQKILETVQHISQSPMSSSSSFSDISSLAESIYYGSLPVAQMVQTGVTAATAYGMFRGRGRTRSMM